MYFFGLFVTAFIISQEDNEFFKEFMLDLFLFLFWVLPLGCYLDEQYKKWKDKS